MSCQRGEGSQRSLGESHLYPAMTSGTSDSSSVAAARGSSRTDSPDAANDNAEHNDHQGSHGYGERDMLHYISHIGGGIQQDLGEEQRTSDVHALFRHSVSPEPSGNNMYGAHGNNELRERYGEHVELSAQAGNGDESGSEYDVSQGSSRQYDILPVNGRLSVSEGRTNHTNSIPRLITNLRNTAFNQHHDGAAIRVINTTYPYNVAAYPFPLVDGDATRMVIPLNQNPRPRHGPPGQGDRSSGSPYNSTTHFNGTQQYDSIRPYDRIRESSEYGGSSSNGRSTVTHVPSSTTRFARESFHTEQRLSAGPSGWPQYSYNGDIQDGVERSQEGNTYMDEDGRPFQPSLGGWQDQDRAP